MDLASLITACALSVEPKSLRTDFDSKVMQALIFEQSGSEPWSFSVQGEGFARAFSTMQDALYQARAVRPDRQKIHVGLAGLPTDPASAAALMFAPCPNVALAMLEISQLVERCKTTAKPAPIYCGIAAYHGSWDRPDTWFADAVRARLEKGNAPDFEMPRDPYIDPDDATADLQQPADRNAALTGSLQRPDDRQHAWSSALFPAQLMKADTSSTDVRSRDHAAEHLRSIGVPSRAPATNQAPGNNPFARRPSEPKR